MDALCRISRDHAGFANVAEFMGLPQGDDGRFFMVEEFLESPLSEVAPLEDIRRVAEIARDLSNGLACIHAAKLAHHDIKLDNCGVDRAGKAKLFDLGSLTSDFCHIRGNIYTRPPELVGQIDNATGDVWESSDVWALGATIFALRSGEYPFVTSADLIFREGVSKNFEGLGAEEIQKAKDEFDEGIGLSLKESGAEDHLFKKVDQHFSGNVAEIMKQMLRFDPEQRPSAASCHEIWSGVCVERTAVGDVSALMRSDQFELFGMLIDSAEQRDIQLTYNQCERIIGSLEGVMRAGPAGAVQSDNVVKDLLARAKALKVKIGKRKAPAMASAQS